MNKLSTHDLAVVKNRFMSLINDAKLASMIHRGENDPRKRTIAMLLHALYTFGQKQFEFFEKGLVDDPTDATAGFLLPEPDSTIRDSFQVINNQIDYDIRVIQSAINKRTSSKSMQEELDQIKLADRLAYLALEPAITHLEVCQSTVLAYLQKSPSVRIIPYAPVAIVGIPPKTDKPNFDQLATPHEVGHYVYWHCLFPQATSPLETGTFRDQILAHINNIGQRECIRNWFEEIFADVYGCLIAGPISALSMLERLKNLDKNGLTTDDRDHPLPALRPYIYAETLKQMAQADSTPSTVSEKLNQAAKELENKWAASLSTRKAGKVFTLHDVSRNEQGTLATTDMEIVLREVVTNLCRGIFGGLLNVQTQSLDTLWYSGPVPADGANMELWSNGFTEFVRHHEVQSQLPEAANYLELESMPQSEPQPRHWFERIRDNVIAQGRVNIPLVGEEMRNDNGEQRQWWHYILDANGWATQGPGPGNVAKD